MGVRPGRLRGRDLAAPYRGLRIPAAMELSLLQRCSAYAATTSQGAVFSHATAAQLIGIPIPIRMLRDHRLHVSVRPPARASKARKIVGHQLDLAESETFRVGGMTATSPERTWCDLALSLSVRELVAAGDFLLARRRPLTTRERLAGAVARRNGRRGAPRLHAALPLLSDRSESAPESILRVMFIDAGLPRLDVNVDLRDPAGRFLARPDLRFPDYRLIIEYEGDGHRTDRAQWRKDITRTSRLQAFGEEVFRVAADDLAQDPGLIQQVSAVLRRRGWRSS